jgi:hypothetical protein
MTASDRPIEGWGHIAANPAKLPEPLPRAQQLPSKYPGNRNARQPGTFI